MRIFLLVVAAALSAAAQEAIPTEEIPIATDPPREFSTYPPSNCRYYCGYEGYAYCCDDGTRPIPPDHDDNVGACVEMEEHICESDAIYYTVVDNNGSNMTKQLFEGSPVDTPPCASDGYCAEDEKCCPTPCARKHLCLAAAAQGDLREYSTPPPSNCRYYCGYDGDAYCCDDGTRPIPPDHNDNAGVCIDMSEHICEDDAIYYNTTDGTGANTTKQLFEGSPVDTPPCASDGYCAEDEKCCPTPCAKKHLCLAAAAQGDLREYSTPPPSNCRYYCGYDGDAYCCDDGTRPIPPDHDDNAGVCVDMSEHICEDDSIYYNTIDGTGANTTKQLFEGSPVDTPPCASDGYCAEDEKCCPTPCARKHLCLAAAAQENTLIEETPTASDCRYFCGYNEKIYCCDDGTRPLPQDHFDHPGTCVDMEEHICKKDGIYHSDESEKSTITKLFTGSPVDTPPCASDGYCASDEKCCPTPCAKKHLCLKYAYTSCRYYCFWANETYCCDDGSLEEPRNHANHEGSCPKIEEEDCDGDREVPIKSGNNGDTQKAAACASDGYCASDEKCCPSKCAQRHVCLKANRIVEEIDENGEGVQELEF
ncbi:uncharacterized protein LOC119597886 [Penaeus monodon]|uniref:uncharacterized protein LOC119597886 n=1 Tax=Penaeus monodon TaxID=6687 RepID=UPI0018A6FB5D|nr:uncharacterized protein LOC119597886 [Penaeus monodon]